MKDIAKALNVSVVTVSRAFRDRPDISEATRNAVLAKMREMQYRPNVLAHSLATGKTNLIGLVIPDLMQTFFAEIAHGITQEFAPTAYQVIIANSEEDAELESREIRTLLARQVDGLIIASAEAQQPSPVLTELRQQGVPFILVDRAVPGLEANFVGVSDERVGRLATQHLIDCGKHRIAHIRGPGITTAEGRLAGYRTTLARAGISVPPCYVVSAAVDDKSGYAAMRKLLSCDPPPDAVFCYNDPVAAGAINAILDAGRKIPGDIAVIGAANMYYSRMMRVPLSSVDQSSAKIGRESAALMLKLLQGEITGTRSVLIRPKLVVRESTRDQGQSIAVPKKKKARRPGQRRSN